MESTKNKDIINHHKKDLLVTLLWDSILHNSLPQPLGGNIKNTIAYWDLNHTLKKLSLNFPDAVDYTPIGIVLKPYKLTVKEQRAIRVELEKMIEDKYPALLEKFEVLTNGDIKKMLKHKRTDQIRLTYEQERLITLCKKYYEQLYKLRNINIEMCQAMKECIDIRLGSSIVSMERRAELCKHNSDINELKIKLLNVQMKRFVYGGSTTVRDYMEYHLSMREKLDNIKKEIHNYKKSLGYDDD